MKIRELLCDESKWCKCDFAVDKNKNSVPALSPNAVQWCLAGAVTKCYDGKERSIIFDKIMNKLSKQHCTIEYWNDKKKRVFADIKKLCEELDI